MNKKIKGFLGILLSVALVMGLMPAMSMTAYADGTSAYNNYLVTTDENKNLSGDALTALQVTFNGKPWYMVQGSGG